MATTSKSKNVLIGCSGSVASVKLEPLVASIKSWLENASIKVILTESAQHFTAVRECTEAVQYYTDADEWAAWSKLGDDVLHIELGKWADVMLIAPLSANTLAKIANGLCDNLLTCTVRAWDINKPLLFAAAMNTRMLEHPITKPHIDTLISWGYTEIPTVSKLLACGDKGNGAMAEVKTITDKLCDVLSQPEVPGV